MSETIKKQDDPRKENNDFPGYPHYPKKEDIYETEEKMSLKDEGDSSDENSDLDVPGTELDDKSEEIGSEDEENNLYSLGGDRHDD